MKLQTEKSFNAWNVHLALKSFHSLEASVPLKIVIKLLTLLKKVLTALIVLTDMVQQELMLEGVLNAQ